MPGITLAGAEDDRQRFEGTPNRPLRVRLESNSVPSVSRPV